MRPGRSARIVGSLLLLGFVGWMFVMVIWLPLYGHRETTRFAETQEEPPVQAEIVREGDGASRTWSVQDRRALTKLRDGLRQADFAGAKEPKSDQKFRLRLRRADSRVDEYEVMLDERGSEHDLLYVVRREGGGSVYGSAFKTPELRSAIQQILKDPAAR